MAVVIACLAWVAGTLAGLLMAAIPRVAPLLVLCGLGWTVLWFRSPVVRWVGLSTVIVGLAILRSAASVAPLPEDHVSHLNGDFITLRGVVLAEPTERGGAQTIRFEVSHLLDDGDLIQATGTVLVTVPRFPEYRYGHELELTGRLQDVDDDGYREYLARQGIHSIIRYPSPIKTLSTAAGDSLSARLFAVRLGLAERLLRLLPEPQASLAVGLVLGDRTGIARDITEAFRTTGTSHILAVSGWHVAVVGGAIGSLAGRLPLGGSLGRALVAALGVCGYALLVGGQPAVMRATLMALVALVARELGRPRDGLVALCLACALMVAAEPRVVLDVGFQLSCAATAGLVLLAPSIQSRLARLPAWLAEALAVTLAAQLAVLPIVIGTFGQMSFVAPLANVILAPLVPGAIEWSAVSLLAGLAFEPLGQMIGLVAWLHLAAMLFVVDLAAQLPGAMAEARPFHPVVVIAYYALLLLWANDGRRALPAVPAGIGLPARRADRALVGLGVAAVLVLAALPYRHDGLLHLTVFAVGQGDAILLRSPAGHQILVDGGPNGEAVSTALGRRLPFWDRDLDLVILTHGHDDHVTGLVDVGKRYAIGRALVGPAPPTPSAAYEAWLAGLNDRGTPVIQAATGQRIDLGSGAVLEVVYAGEGWDGSEADLNTSSLVLRLTWGESSALLAADAGPDVQRRLLESGRCEPTDIVKVPHHGAANVFDEICLSVLGPEVALISVAEGNRFGHPAAETLALLANRTVFRTDRDGDIDVVMRPDGYSIAVGR